MDKAKLELFAITPQSPATFQIGQTGKWSPSSLQWEAGLIGGLSGSPPPDGLQGMCHVIGKY